LDVCEFWRGGDVGTDDWHDRGVRVEDGDAVVEDEQLVPVTEVKRDAHLVVGQCSGGKGHTGVASKEEGKRKIQSLAHERIANNMRSDEAVHVAYHVVVAHAFAGAHGEGSPEVEVVVVESLGHKIIE